MKRIEDIYRAREGHWVGDGFPVRTLFSYDEGARERSPFLLFDYAGPWTFDPTTGPRGAGAHPHRGFETVTIIFDGEVSHQDSTGAKGTIGPGDVQWMTAGRGVVHQEYHSASFAQRGGRLRMVQLWVNLPAKDKMSAPAYQPITSANIPVVELAGGAGHARIIAGAFGETKGPARTFTPIDIWDLNLNGGVDLPLEFPEGRTVLLGVLAGAITVNGTATAGEAEVVQLSRSGKTVTLRAEASTILLVLAGEPIDEPVIGHGPFVMNSRAEIMQAIEDFNRGRLGGANAV